MEKKDVGMGLLGKKKQSPLHSFPGSKSRDEFWLLGGYRWVEKCWKRITSGPERLRTRALMSYENFPMYAHYGHVGAIPTCVESLPTL